MKIKRHIWFVGFLMVLTSAFLGNNIWRIMLFVLGMLVAGSGLFLVKD